jgi:hypothetical protein
MDGRERVSTGEVLIDVADRTLPFFVALSAEVQVLRVADGTEMLITTHHRGQFSGEANLFTGRPALARLRVSAPGEVIELTREQVLGLVQTDAELSEILMRTFILRRLEFIARDFGDVVVVGSTHSAGTLRVKEFLTRNGHPFTTSTLDRDREAQEILDRFHVSVDDVPVLICRGDAVLRIRPTADRRLPWVQRGGRLRASSRSRRCRRRSGGPRSRCLRCVRGPRRAGDRIADGRRSGRIELTHRKTTLAFRPVCRDSS